MFYDIILSNMKIKDRSMRINLEGLLNVRDLGGITTVDNRRVKLGRIIRSDNLSSATENDCKKLKEYGLKMIVDFRTEDEISASPDKEICQVQWIHNPILKCLTTGITKKDEKKASCLEELLLNFSLELGIGGKRWLKGLYAPLVSDRFSLNGYRKFLDILSKNKDGAILYHCSAGKDRVGVGTLIFLSALGVSRESIIKDYLITNESYADVIAGAIELGKRCNVDKEILDTIQPLSGVDVEYIENAFEIIDNTFGGTDAFLKNQLGLTDEYIARLKDNYLE